MANLVTCQTCADLGVIQMSNGLTDVFISVVSLAASALAKSDHQREIAAWFASHDQSIFGLGMVGFDVSELPWWHAKFDEDRTFLRKVIASAKAKTGWERLGYPPRPTSLRWTLRTSIRCRK